MATVESWFWGPDGWAAKHTERCPRGDWPPFESEYWQEIRQLFVIRGATEEEAHAASRSLFANQPEFVGDHPSAIRGALDAVRREARTPAAKALGYIADQQAENEKFDRPAAAHWAAITEAERNDARQLVERYKRAANFRVGGKLAELLAGAWAYDPRSVIIPAPETRREEVKLPRGVKQVFQNPQFKE